MLARTFTTLFSLAVAVSTAHATTSTSTDTTATILGFKLIHAPTDRELMDLTNGVVVDPVALGVTAKFNIRAVTTSGVKSVLFLPNNRNEATAPFAYCGDMNGDYYNCPEFAAGKAFTVTARGKSRSGAIMEDVSIHFSIRATSAPVRPPVPTPKAAPTRAPALRTRTPTLSPTRRPTVAPTHIPTMAPTRAPTKIPVALRINCGGDDYVDTLGQMWHADKFFVGGGTFGNFVEIAATLDDTIYQTERWGMSTYDIPLVAPGDYRVVLHFAEIYVSNVGDRVFEVEVNGEIFEGVDIVQLGQGVSNKAVTIEVMTTALEGTITIRLLENIPYTNNPKISAIEVLPISN